MTARFSIVILCYRHFEYLYSAIDSVLCQDYPDIELVVSDDCSPGFPREEVEAYITAHKGGHIRNVVIRQEPVNAGTVKHINHALDACGGEYVLFLAGDDVLDNPHVLSAYVDGFSHAPEGCYVEMAQTAMYDETLTVLDSYYLKPRVRQAIQQTETGSSEQLLELLIRYGACLPSTSTCFQCGFFERFGKFDEDYALVEDYPTHIRLAKEGWIIHYENFVAVKHRHGGISHGQTGALSLSRRLYYQDEKRMLQKLRLANVHLLPPERRAETASMLRAHLRWLDTILAQAPHKLPGVGARHLSSALKLFVYKTFTLLRQVQIKLLVLWLGLLFFLPEIAGMLCEIFPVPFESVQAGLHTVSLFLPAIWGVVFLADIVSHVFLLIDRFPLLTEPEKK